MNDKNSGQSAKDVLEDVKNVMYNKGSHNFKLNDEEKDMSYFQDEDDEFLNFENKKNVLGNVGEKIKPSDTGDIFSPPEKPFSDIPRIRTDNLPNINDTQKQKISDDNLLSQENINASSREIQHLVEQVYKSRRSSEEYGVTIEELTINLLKPELSKWLNSHLHGLVKEIVEKEIKHITGSN